jgi:hypothetical protein
MAERVAPRCAYVHASGRACGGFAIAGSPFCFAHAPEQAAKRTEARRRGGRAGRDATVPDSDLSVRSLGDVLALVELTINDVRTGRIDVRIANAIGVLANVAARTIQQADIEQRLAALEAVLEPERVRALARRRGA